MKSKILALLIVSSIAPAVAGQSSDDQTRQIVAEEFLKARPAPPKPANTPRPRYKPAPSSAAVKPAAAAAELGLTLWRLRPSRAADEGARLLVQDTAAEMTAERIDTGTPLSVGDRVRLSIESPSAGFLYVIDRELYADGTMSEPYLIFPTSRTRQGDNSVRGGRLVDIPDQQDRPNYFTVKPSRPGQVGEQLTIIVSPAPLADDLKVSDQPTKLAQSLVESWQKSWGAPVQQFLHEGGAATWTRQEQTAAADGSRLLTQDDPPPHTIFRVAARKGSPILVNVKLPYATAER